MRHELAMSLRRPGMWIGYGLLIGFYVVTSILPVVPWAAYEPIAAERVWPEAGLSVFMFNIFFPLLAGILSADRMQRDFRGGVRELQRSTPLGIGAYILSKYLGVLISMLIPFFAMVLINTALMIGLGIAPPEFALPSLLGFLLIALPAHAFVVAFSLACPLVIPLRVYQVLFTGYWFWGNLLSPQAFPTISRTLLNAVGQIPLQVVFREFQGSTHTLDTGYTPLDAVLNPVILAACITVVLLVLNRYILRREAEV
jgi:ABC-type transport system involved in multi-copper enzyme maturation permease subunit